MRQKETQNGFDLIALWILLKRQYALDTFTFWYLNWKSPRAMSNLQEDIHRLFMLRATAARLRRILIHRCNHSIHKTVHTITQHDI